jgi:polar amino acid transport system substrate-binding protein
MKNLTLGILLIAIGLAGFLMYKRRGQPRSAPLHNTITAGTTADFPPFSFRDSSNDIVGFDIDIAREVARRLDKNIEFQDMPFDSLIPQLKNGTIHIIAAGISATPERKQSVLFTDPYLTGNPLVVLSKKDSGIDTFKDIKNKKVIVNTGYLGDLYMSKIDDINLQRVTSVSDGFLFLDKDQGDAFIGSYQSIRPYLDKYGKDTFNWFIIKETDENSSLAVSPMYQSLLKNMQKALDEMSADGTLKSLKNKWNIA